MTVTIQRTRYSVESQLVRTVEIKKYAGDVYRKYRRGELEVMDASTIIQEIVSMNGELKEVTRY
jgi:hypothetical protein